VFSCQNISFYGARREGYQYARVASAARLHHKWGTAVPEATRIMDLGPTCYSSLHVIGRLVDFDCVEMQSFMDDILK
jgi:hypothetical protein